MRLIYILIFFIVFISCKKQEFLEVYICEPINDDSVIRGQSLDKFFDTKSDKRKINIQKINLTKDLNNEMDKLKESLENNGNIDKGIGIYYFALIRGNDTLYSSSDLESWKYKDFVNVYESDLIKKTVFKSTK